MKQYMKYAISLLIGGLAGCLTLCGQRVLPINLNFLANSGAVWMIPAFFVGLRFGGKALSRAVGCTLCLIGCVLGYYGFEALMNRHAFSVSVYVCLWLGIALGAGVAGGIAAYWAGTRSDFLKCIGLNLVPAVFLSEGVSKLIHISEYMHMIYGVGLTVVAGGILYILLNRREALRARNLLSVGVLLLAGECFFEALYRFTT